MKCDPTLDVAAFRAANLAQLPIRRFCGLLNQQIEHAR
jgi:hypothetical protein